MPLGVQLFEDGRKLALLARIATAVESIAETLKASVGEQIDPAEVAAVTEGIKDSTKALADALPPST
jgi:hypothetical protein